MSATYPKRGRPMKHIAEVIISLCTLAAAPACLGTQAAQQDAPEVDEAALLQSVQNYRTSGEFVEITTETFQSAIAADAPLRVWISKFAAVAYGVIDPDLTGSEVRLPEGAL